MKTGELVTDSQGTTWTVGQELGRGAWGRSFVARSHNGREAVLKVALEAADLFGDESDALARACNQIVDEQAGFMRDRRRPGLPDLIDVFTTPQGARALLTVRYPSTFATRLKAGASLDAMLGALLQACDHVSGATHGNLRPSNLLLADDGSVRLSDPWTPALEAHGARLLARAGDRRALRPPEAGVAPASTWDTWALCALLWWVSSQGAPGADGRRDDPAPLPAGGLDKVALSSIKDKVSTRLQSERANPRFATRLADKLGTLLNRGLSAQAAPSPPYRFANAAELRGRLAEVHELVDPKVEAVGKVLLAATAKDGNFENGALAAFSTTVTCTPGVGIDDLIAGLLVRDLDAEGDDRVPVPEARFSCKPHPSGRLRFDFELPELRPGRYTVRVAFSVKESGHEPVTADGHFEIRPPPGYVPPVEDAEVPSALPFRANRPEVHVGVAPGFDDDLPSSPSPIAPSDPGVLSQIFSDGPPPVLQSVRGRRTDPGQPEARPGDLRADPHEARPAISLGNRASDPNTSGFGPGSPSSPGSYPGVPQAGPATSSGAPSSSGPPSAPASPSSAGVGAPPTLKVAPSLRPPASEAPPREVPRPIPSIAPPAPDAPEPEVTAELTGAAGSGRRASWSPKAGGRTPDRASVDPAWGGSATWEAVPAAQDLRDEPLLPGSDGMDDLPSFEPGERRPEGVGAMVEQVLQIVRDNVWLALGVVIAILVLMLVVAGILFQTFAT